MKNTKKGKKQKTKNEKIKFTEQIRKLDDIDDRYFICQDETDCEVGHINYYHNEAVWKFDAFDSISLSHHHLVAITEFIKRLN